MGVRLNVTEWMRGEVVDKAGRTTTFVHEVLIQMRDIDAFIADPKHDAPMTGTVTWGDEACPIDTARFDMLVATTKPNIRHMYYRIVFTDRAGTKRTMLGNKRVSDDRGADLWGDITTLFIRIYDGVVDGISLAKTHDDPPEYPPGEVATGKLHIPLEDGINSFLSFDAPDGDKLSAVSKFIKFYAGEAFELFINQSKTKRTLLFAGLGATALAIIVVIALALRS
jgi:hypothetical protein